MLFVYLLIFLVVVPLTYFLLEICLGFYRTVKRKNSLHDIEIRLLKLEHQSLCNGLMLENIKARIETLEAKMGELEMRLQMISAHITLAEFKLWWKTVGQYEYEIVRKHNPRANQILRLN